METLFFKKTMMSEELRDLQYEVYTIEDHVFCNSKYGSLGLYGVLKNCRLQLSDKKNGGDGKLMWTEPMDRADKEDEYKIGIDEKDKIGAVSEEFLKDGFTRFQVYRKLVKMRDLDYDEKWDICEADLKSRRYDQQIAEEEKGASAI